MNKILKELEKEEEEGDFTPKEEKVIKPVFRYKEKDKSSKKFWVLTSILISLILSALIAIFGWEKFTSQGKYAVFYLFGILFAVFVYTIILDLAAQLIVRNEEYESSENRLTIAVLCSVFLVAIGLLHTYIIPGDLMIRLISQSISMIAYYAVIAVFFEFSFVETASLAFVCWIFRILVVFLLFGFKATISG